jgi:hypothetical protein
MTAPAPDSLSPEGISPEGMAVLAPLLQLKQPGDADSPYVAALESSVDLLAREKKRLTIKWTRAEAEIRNIVREVEKELGPMGEAQKREFWAGIRNANPVVNDTDEPIVAELTGLVYPNNWGGTAKYNLTKTAMPDKTCKMLYGFRVSLSELTHLVTKVYFPGMAVQRSSMEHGTSLSNFERALATLQLFKTGENVADIAHHWGVHERTMGRYTKEWSQKWSEVAKVFCRLDPDAEIFAKMQPVGYNYPVPIACQVDGTCVGIQTSRKYSAKARASYSDKTHTQAAQGITWSSCIGLVLLCTSLYCARVAEKELVRLHSSWLDIFPPRHGRLVDRGFTFCTQWYKNLIRAFSPAFVNRATGDITHRQVINARRQSADRYVCEVVYSRVKSFRILTGRCPVSRLQYLTPAWYVGHMVANMYKPLVTPDCMDTWEMSKVSAASYESN